MQSEQIINEVKRYLEDENYRYAIMIDGNWGCGKTHFVLHDLTSAIKEYEEKNRRRDIKYISLYGCESVEDVEKNVYWSILDKKIFELKEQVQTNIPTKTVYGEMAEKREKSQRVVLTMTKRLALQGKILKWLQNLSHLINTFLFLTTWNDVIVQLTIFWDILTV